MKKSVVFFEVEGGNDKGADGHRKDTMPMVEALRRRGWKAKAVYYRESDFDTLVTQIPEEYDTYVSRINPGHIPGGEARYFELLGKLCRTGVIGMPALETMITFGAKDALVKLRDMEIVPGDTYVYREVDEFRQSFPSVLSSGVRVLKQNRGSTGSGIWRVEFIDDRPIEAGETIPFDALVRCTEALDNHTDIRILGEFMEFCNQYLDGQSGMILDMPYFPRIIEGEIRIMFVGESPIFVVRKRPAKGGFSATLFSGARYTYEDPRQWRHLVEMFLNHMPEIQQRLGGHDIPLIWTADFIPDTNPDGSARYVLSEINCSCVGFTSHLEAGIQEKIADEIIRVTIAKKG